MNYISTIIVKKKSDEVKTWTVSVWLIEKTPLEHTSRMKEVENMSEKMVLQAESHKSSFIFPFITPGQVIKVKIFFLEGGTLNYN